MASDQELLGPLKQAGLQEPFGLLETMGPLELDGASGQEPMGRLEQAGALDQEPMGLIWRPWVPLRIHGPQIKSQLGAFGGHGVPLETMGPSWRPLGLLELAGVLD